MRDTILHSLSVCIPIPNSVLVLSVPLLVIYLGKFFWQVVIVARWKFWHVLFDDNYLQNSLLVYRPGPLNTKNFKQFFQFIGLANGILNLSCLCVLFCSFRNKLCNLRSQSLSFCIHFISFGK